MRSHPYMAPMTAQITRALLCFMMLLTGLSAAEAACPETAQRQGAEALSSISKLDAAAASAQLVGPITSTNDAPAASVGVAGSDTEYAIATAAYPYSTPPTRHDLALE
jgi:hypothetical protein